MIVISGNRAILMTSDYCDIICGGSEHDVEGCNRRTGELRMELSANKTVDHEIYIAPKDNKAPSGTQQAPCCGLIEPLTLRLHVGD